ncbi:poly(3-hydroxybutyrate) depolymerase-like protein [Ancylobacter lacus]|nr:poly(3-hydroxybutyrate) depolymerase-like protein [Ancylobacter lacus]
MPPPPDAESVPLPAGRGEIITITSGGRRREFILRMPGHAGPGPWPLVIALHGAWQPARVFQSYLDLDDIADQEGFVVAYPKGLNLLWNDGRGSVAGIMPILQSRDDGAFILGVKNLLVAQGIADPGRSYLMGFSNGGFLTAYIACRYADSFAAFATMMMTAPKVYAETCRPSRPVPILLMNGTYDPIVPMFGRPTPGAELMSAHESAELFARLDGCNPPSLTRTAGASITRWDSCAGGTRVAFYEIEGGHQPPARSVGPMDTLASLVLGPRRSGMDAPQEIWNFFRQYGDWPPPAGETAPGGEAAATDASSSGAAPHGPSAHATTPPPGGIPLPPPSPLRRPGAP